MLTVCSHHSAFLSVSFFFVLHYRAGIADLYNRLAARTHALRSLVLCARRLWNCDRGDVCPRLLLGDVVSSRRTRMGLWVQAVRRVGGSHAVAVDV